MPNINDGWKTILNSQFHCSEYHIDMVRDFCEIVCTNLALFQEKRDEFETDRANKAIRSLTAYSKPPVHRYRVYLVSGLQSFSCAWITDSNKEFSKFMAAVQNEFSQCEIMPINNLDPNLVSTMFIFENTDIICAEHIYPYHLAWLLEKLSKVNLIHIE